ncbi:MAG: hypothetical protein ACLQIB_16310 [Isosphaeraceae bacterium]
MADADEAYAWIAEHRSPAQAERWYQGLIKQMETLTRSAGLVDPGRITKLLVPPVRTQARRLPIRPHDGPA